MGIGITRNGPSGRAKERTGLTAFTLGAGVLAMLGGLTQGRGEVRKIGGKEIQIIVLEGLQNILAEGIPNVHEASSTLSWLRKFHGLPNYPPPYYPAQDSPLNQAS